MHINKEHQETLTKKKKTHIKFHGNYWGSDQFLIYINYIICGIKNDLSDHGTFSARFSKSSSAQGKGYKLAISLILISINIFK